ncbi:MAG TPA: PAS domain-containing protein [Polyangiales bacterium]
MHSHAPYPSERSVRRRARTLEGPSPTAALNAFVAALDVTTEAVLIIDRDGVVVHANPASEALFACDACDTIVGQRLLSLYAIAASSLRKILSDLHKHRVWRGDLPVQRGNMRLDLAVALRTIELSPGRSDHFCLVARPRTASDASVLSAVGRVASEMAHDFNNQIAVVINYSFILLRQLPDDSPLRAHVTEMQTAAWRASQVAQEMLGFGGQRNAEADEIDLNALLGDVQALFAHALREDTRLVLRLGQDVSPVRARRAHLEWLLVEVASRMRATLGPIESFDVTTSNAEAIQSEETGPTERGSSVLISVEARARTRDRAVIGLGSHPLQLAAGTSGLRGAELALAHARGELTVQHLPDGALRYRIRLPSAV